MLREKVIKKDAKGNETLLTYYLRGENDDAKRVVVYVDVNRLGMGGKKETLAPGESIRFESEKE